MIDKKKEEVKLRVAELSEQMRKLQRMARLLAGEEWREVMSPWLKTEIDSLSMRLETIDMKPIETTAVRGMLAAWRILAGLQEKTLRKMEAIAEQAASLHKQLERWHTRGHDDLGTTVEAASKIADQRSTS